jgi:hypothetical protein
MGTGLSDPPVSSPERNSPRWLGCITPDPRFRAGILRGARRLADRAGPLPVWIVWGLLLGVLPLVFDFFTKWYTHWLVTPVLMLPLLLAAVSRDRAVHGMTLLVSMLASHCAASILLAAYAPEVWGKVFPAGADYWTKSRLWITTGQSEEYQLAWWLPAHVQLAVGMVLLTYLSMGLIPLWQGFHEIGLMNFYVGRLVAHSEDSVLAVAMGWHPWSVCRGIGYLFLTYEVTSLSFAHFTGTRLSTPGARRCRWVLGITFLVADGVLKYQYLDSVRRVLASNLL